MSDACLSNAQTLHTCLTKTHLSKSICQMQPHDHRPEHHSKTLILAISMQQRVETKQLCCSYNRGFDGCDRPIRVVFPLQTLQLGPQASVG